MRSNRVRDNQRSQAYTWERTMVDRTKHKPLEKAALKLFTNVALRLYGVSPVRIRTHAGRGHCATYKVGGVNEIRYSTSRAHQSNLVCVLHEAAHVIVDSKYTLAAGHGKEWVAVYSNLLDAFGVGDKVSLKVAARRMGVKVSSIVPEPDLGKLPAILRAS